MSVPAVARARVKQRQITAGWRDVGLAVGFCLADLTVFWDTGPLQGQPATKVVTLVTFAVVGYLPLIWRRRAPVTVFWLSWLHGLLGVALFFLVVPGYFPLMGMLLALYTIAACGDRRASLAALVAMTAPALRDGIYQMLVSPTVWLKAFVTVSILHGALAVLVWATGRWRWTTERLVADLDARREAEAREAVALERLSIARELHDIVAHAVTIMVLHTAGARRMSDRNTPRAGQALDQVEDLGRQAMDELRRMLLVLRGDEASGEADAPTDPAAERPAHAARLADLPALIARINAAGIPAALAVDGNPRPASGDVELVAYRVAQEALTNVTRHAGPGARATVTISWTDHTLKLDISDDGHGDPQLAIRGLSTGNGLRGLHERVTAAGGSLSHGPLPDGGFQVTVALPLQPARPPALVAR